MTTQKFYFEISGKKRKYYKIYEYSGKFYAQFNYNDSIIWGEEYTDIGKAYSYDEAMTICRSHALQFGKIEKLNFR